MSISTWRNWKASSVIVVVLCAAASQSALGSPAAILSKADGLAISRKAATAHGYDLSHYKLDTFGDQGAAGKKEWMFVYLCSPGSPPPGCFFMVVVNRRTGIATVHPGE